MFKSYEWKEPQEYVDNISKKYARNYWLLVRAFSLLLPLCLLGGAFGFAMVNGGRVSVNSDSIVFMIIVSATTLQLTCFTSLTGVTFTKAGYMINTVLFSYKRLNKLLIRTLPNGCFEAVFIYKHKSRGYGVPGDFDFNGLRVFLKEHEVTLEFIGENDQSLKELHSRYS